MSIFLSVLVPGAAVAAEETEEPAQSISSQETTDEQRSSSPAAESTEPSVETEQAEDTKVVADPSVTPVDNEPELAEETAADGPSKAPAKEPVAAPEAIESADVSAEDEGSAQKPAAKLAAPLQAPAKPAVAGVCDTNSGDGSVTQFAQRSDETDWTPGNVHDGLYEGGVVHERVIMNLPAGENELVIQYKVKEASKWAYDFLLNYEITGPDGTSISNINVIPGGSDDAAERTDTVEVTIFVGGDEPENNVVLFFDAHIASELDHGPGTGASSINGSPYHVNLLSLNCAPSGQQDNQIQAAAVQVGFVTVVKEAVPADGTDFDFTLFEDRFGDSVGFQLDDSAESDMGNELPDSVTYTVAPSNVTISEQDIPEGWSLNNLVCEGTNATWGGGSSITFALADNQQVTCTFTNEKVQYADLSLTKTVEPSFDRDYDWTIDKHLAEGQEQTVSSENSTEGFDYQLDVTASEAKDDNFELSGTITVTNPNDVAVDGVSLSDELDGAQCTISRAGEPIGDTVSVAPGENQFSYECDLPDSTTAESAGTNTVSATWDADAYYGTTGTAEGSADYDFSAVNPNITDGEVTVTDDHYDLSTLPGGNVVHVSEAPKSFSYTLDWDGTPGHCVEGTNTATLTSDDAQDLTDSQTVELCVGANLSVSKNVVTSFDRSYLWGLDKELVSDEPITADENGEFTAEYRVTVTREGTSDSNWAMSGEITVQNPNEWQDIEATVTDNVDIGGGAQCTVTGVVGEPERTDADPATPGFQVTISQETRELVFSYNCIFDSQPEYEGTNTATVSWDREQAHTTESQASGAAEVTTEGWSQTPVNKQVEITDDHFDFEPDWVLDYDSATDEELTRNYTLSWTVTEQGTCQIFTNVATLTGSEGLVLGDEQAVTGCREASLTVDKSVDAGYDRTYLWDIDKEFAEGQEPEVIVDNDGNATVTYRVTASNTGYTDSNQHMSGVITVSNPNDYKDVEVTVADQTTLEGVACVIDPEQDVNPGVDGVQILVPAATAEGNGQAQANYACDVSAVTEQDYSGHSNTATVSWGEGNEANSAPIPVEFLLGNTTDEAVDVYDDMAGTSENPQWLGSVNVKDGSGSFDYQIEFTDIPRDEQCHEFTNVAWVDLSGGENPRDSLTVSVCDQKQLTVTKEVTAGYDRDYNWSIEKQVEQSRYFTDGDGQVTARYTVTATPSEPMDSDKSVAGTITVNNPNTGAGDQLVTVSDTLGIPESSCLILGTDADAEADGFQVMLGDGEQITLDYECQIPADTDVSQSYENTASINWGVDRSATATVEFDFELNELTDDSVQVTDDQTNPENPVQLGTATVNDPQSQVFSYDLQLDGVAGECTSYTNTAVIDEVRGADEDNTGSALTEVCAGAELVLDKNVVTSFDRSYDWDIQKEVLGQSPFAADPDTGEVTVDYRVTVTPTGHEDSNWAMSGTIELQNPNSWQDIAVTLMDETDIGGGASCQITGTQDGTVADMSPDPGFQTVIPADTTWVLNYLCEIPEQPNYEGRNVATATWDAAQAHTAQSTASAEAPVVADEWSQTPLNETVTITDSRYDFDPEWTVELSEEPQSRDYSVTWTVDQAGECQEFENIATLTGADGLVKTDNEIVQACREAALEISKTVQASYDRSYLWDVQKDLSEGQEPRVVIDEDGTARVEYTAVASNTGYQDSDWTLDGTITVRNPNEYTSLEATLEDHVQLEGVTCTPSQSEISLPAGGEVTVDYDCDLSAGVSEEDYAQSLNTATVSWGEDRSASVEQTFSFDLDVQSDHEVSVFDDFAGTTEQPQLLGTATVDESPKSFDYSVELQGEGGVCTTHTNTAWIDLSGENDPRSEAQVQVCEQLPLSVTKDAAASFDRLYLWDLQKLVDRTKLTVDQNHTANFRYTVAATPDGVQDSGHRVTGTIAVSNPNAFAEAETIATVSDSLDIQGVSCSVMTKDEDPEADGLQVLIPAGSAQGPAMVELDYECLGTPEQLDGTNTVSVNWGEGRKATASAAVHYDIAKETNKSVTVLDDKANPDSEPIQLGVATWNAEGNATEFSYLLQHRAVTGECTKFTNTAQIAETGQDAQSTVQLCGRAAPKPPVLVETGVSSAIWTLMGLGAATLVGGALLLLRTRRRMG
ncbi:prealbumin-like fold domain-containing protein [Glutamicibacter sp. X7]